MLRISIVLLALISWHLVPAQSVQMVKYTTREGLPSNSVYKTVLDKKGFLWIATENGVARFDGKKFDTYTTAKGLTDNEVVDLFPDSSGTIWAIPFRRSPCYYNPVKDRFENEKTDPELTKIDLANTHKVHVLQYGGVVFSNNERNFFIYKNGKSTAFINLIPRQASVIDKIIEYRKGDFVLIAGDSIRQFRNGTITHKIPFIHQARFAEFINNRLYLVSGTSIEVYTLTTDGTLHLSQTKKYPFEIRIFNNTGKNFAVTSVNGNTYLIDTATLELKENIYSDVHIRHAFEDNDGNIWLSTLENGLIKMQQLRIFSYTAVNDLKQNFNTLLKTKKFIAAGNNNGEVYIYDGAYGLQKISLNKTRNIDAWVRKIVPTSKGIYVATQSGSYFLDMNRKVITKKFTGSQNKSSKTAIRINDSILGLGTHAYAWKYNLNSNRFTDSIAKRVICMAATPDGQIFIGSNDGLFRWHKDTLIAYGKKYPGLSSRINTMAFSADSLLWIGLGSDSLLVLKNDVLIASIPLGGPVPGNICKSLLCTRPGEVWLGTNKGLNRIHYRHEGKKITFTNTYFSTADGLIGEQINDLAFFNDTVYAATTGGISYLPASLTLPVSDIQTYITRVAFNGKDADQASAYKVPFSQNDIFIGFSGVDLTGYIPLFEYSINGNEWSIAEKLELKELSPGTYNIRIRAKNRDGTPSSKITSLSITVKTPFWKNPYYILLFALPVFVTILYFLQKRNKQRQKAALAQVLTEKKIAELEMQALKAQINPHFVFNCLNSIKSFIYERNFEQADLYLDKFSELLRRTMDNADASIITLEDEICYLNNYLILEQQRFINKFDYSVAIGPDIDKQKTYVPAMLLQPYVENAIRHGIRFLDNKKGFIRIQARKENGFLICEIDDNGIGRNKARQMRSALHIEYQSRGMQLSIRRAELYHIRSDIIDKKDDKGNPAGTTIRLFIPDTLKP
jgi:hypothetical protein